MRSRMGGGGRLSDIKKKKIVTITNDWFWGGEGGPVTTALLISNYDLDPLNRFVLVNFDPDVYHSTGGGLLASDLLLTFSQNGGVATALAITTITRTDDSALQGGENQIKVNLSFTGNPSGVETFTITPSAAGSYKDGSNNYVSASDTTGVIAVLLELDPLYKNGLATMLTNSFAIPSLPQRLIENQYFLNRRANGSLLTRAGLHLLGFSLDMCRINFITGTLQGTIVGAPGVTLYQGFLAVTGGYIDTNWDALTDGGVLFLQDDASMMVYITNDGQSAGTIMGARGGATANIGNCRIQVRSASDLATGNINHNNSGSSTSGASANAIGTHMVSRAVSTTVNYYFNGVLLDDGTTTSSVLSDEDIFIGGPNLDGTVGTTDNIHRALVADYGLADQAKALTIHQDNATLAAALNALTPTFSGRYYVMGGQSNADQSQQLLSDLTAGQAALYNNGPFSIANGYPANVYDWNHEEGIYEFLEPGVNGVNRGVNYFGPVYPYMYAEALKHPGEDLFIMRHAIGGTGMYNSLGLPGWLPGGAPDSQYEVFKAKYNASIAAMVSVTSFAKFYWWQGEKDAADLTEANAYEANEQTMMAAIKSDTGFDDFIVTKPHVLSPATYISTIRTAKDNNFATGTVYGPLGAIISVDDLNLNGHLPATDCITAAQRAAAAQ